MAACRARALEPDGLTRVEQNEPPTTVSPLPLPLTLPLPLPASYTAGVMVSTIVSGGQTGADRAALDAARAAGVPIGGWVPRDRWAEDGRVPDHYHEMRETLGDDPAERTARNVMTADGTLLVSHGPPLGGSALTRVTAERAGKPCLWIDLDVEPAASALARVQAWLAEHRVQVLNVAGPRASEDPTIYEAVFVLVSALLARSR